MTQEKIRYVKVPIYLNGELFNDYEEAVTVMIYFGIYNTAKDRFSDSDSLEESLLSSIDYLEIPLTKDNTITESVIKAVDDYEQREGFCGVFFMVKIEMLLEFLFKDKTQKEVIDFAFRNAFNSILGTSKISKTNYDLVMLRVIGYKSKKEISYGNLPDFKKSFIDEYKGKTKPWKYNRLATIKNRLMDNWHFVFDNWKSKGGYFTMGNRLTLEQFIDEVKKRKKPKSEQIRDRLKDARV